MRKKKWTTPLLTVVVRGKPEEERVLCYCKGRTGGPSNNAGGNCRSGGYCPHCNTISSS